MEEHGGQSDAEDRKGQLPGVCQHHDLHEEPLEGLRIPPLRQKLLYKV